ncbi:MAG: hypothetical protein EAZ14_01525 [Runella slithyformis]|nr:MAG: hypothetical protein EAZ14_01525 [Runella slithyformis]
MADEGFNMLKLLPPVLQKKVIFEKKALPKLGIKSNLKYLVMFQSIDLMKKFGIRFKSIDKINENHTKQCLQERKLMPPYL